MKNGQVHTHHRGWPTCWLQPSGLTITHTTSWQSSRKLCSHATALRHFATTHRSTRRTTTHDSTCHHGETRVCHSVCAPQTWYRGTPRLLSPECEGRAGRCIPRGGQDQSNASATVRQSRLRCLAKDRDTNVDSPHHQGRDSWSVGFRRLLPGTRGLKVTDREQRARFFGGSESHAPMLHRHTQARTRPARDHGPTSGWTEVQQRR